MKRLLYQNLLENVKTIANDEYKLKLCYNLVKSLIKTILVDLINEDKMQGKGKKVKKGDYLKNGVKACKKLNKQLDRPTFDI